jgi:hypothetical protein
MTIESPAGDVITNDTNAVTLYKDIRPQIVVSDLQSNGTSDESTTTNIS